MASTAQDSSAPLRALEKKDEDHDEDVEFSPFYGIEKGAVLQEARMFNDRNIDARRCQQVITKLLFLLSQGETFSKKEQSEVFFSVTKLFQNKDVNLRRMVYLIIKDVCPGEDERIIITSSLMKDMNSKTDLYRSNAIRVLCSICGQDTQLLVQIERYLKQAIVDKSVVVLSAVLVSAFHLLQWNSEIVKRWANEIQEAVQSKSGLVQFHAVALLHGLRRQDRLAVSKLVTTLVRTSVRSPLANCLLIRYVSQVIAESASPVGNEPRPFYDFLDLCLRHKSEMVVYEAARAICSMKDVTSRELVSAMTTLQLFLSSGKPISRFAAVRTLNKIAQTHPVAVAVCNVDLEALISDSNRSIATLAITTLLRTGSESSVERLLKQISSFISDIADDFKIVVVEAIRSLCLKFPAKHRALMNFLSTVLREDGGAQFKQTIVDSVLILIREIPDAKESGLAHLCEFIEDCEFTNLSVQILHLMGAEGPRCKQPARYIRHIYNRIILENATVRAAAVSSLAVFGASVESLTPRVVTLLKRALYDNDDEVRDRATLYLKQLTGQAGGPEAIRNAWPVPGANLENSLQSYLEGPTDAPFSLESVPKAVVQTPKAASTGSAPFGGASSAAPTAAAAAAAAKEAVAALQAVPELAAVGEIFRSTSPVQLTEEGTEYCVTATKHITSSAVILQFDCTNTVEEQVLETISVAVDLEDAPDFEETSVVLLATMPLGQVGSTFVVLQRPEGSFATGIFACTLRFTIKEIDPSTGEAEEEGFQDEYRLEDLVMDANDYISATPEANFRAAWDELPDETEMTDDYGLGTRPGLEPAVDAVLSTLGMAPCENTHVVPPHARSHTVLLAGTLVGGLKTLVRLRFGIDAQRNVAMNLACRSTTSEVSEAVHMIISEA